MRARERAWERQGDVEVEQHFSHSCARSIFVTRNGIELKLLPWRWVSLRAAPGDLPHTHTPSCRQQGVCHRHFRVICKLKCWLEPVLPRGQTDQSKVYFWAFNEVARKVSSAALFIFVMAAPRVVQAKWHVKRWGGELQSEGGHSRQLSTGSGLMALDKKKRENQATFLTSQIIKKHKWNKLRLWKGN